MDTFLTLVIAAGGIATGIGAIWTAWAARRQAQISERQAQLTKRSLNELLRGQGQGKFSELRLDGVLRSSPGGAKMYSSTEGP